MVARVPNPPNGKDNPADTLAEVATLLKEAGEQRRKWGSELARRLTVPLPELADELLRDGGA